tara:strand:+ start:9587 stop:10186 length:600 start_codon:yes stop_codon:yes gene_type:complete
MFSIFHLDLTLVSILIVRNQSMYKLTLKDYKNNFNKLFASLCLFSNKYLDDIEKAKDIVQEVYIKVWEENIAFNNENAIKSYLYTSVKNKSLDYLKSKHYKSTKHFSADQIEKLEKESYFLREVVVAETSNIIDNAISTLPARCAKIIRLSIKDFKNSEIDEEMGISINTVKAQKKIAYKRLKPLLKDYFFLIAFAFSK